MAEAKMVWSQSFGTPKLLLGASAAALALAHAGAAFAHTQTPDERAGTLADQAVTTAGTDADAQTTATPDETSTSSATAEPVGQADIIVTATRQGPVALQRVPMAISTLAPEDLTRKNLNSLSDYLNTVPAVNVEGAGGFNRVQMRGIVSTRGDYTNIQDRSLVSIYVDDAVVTLNNANPDLRILDLERIEILRGPQGTLYGAGSMAGTIRYITRKPRADDFSGLVELTGGRTTHGGADWNARGMFNVPLVQDQLAASLAVYQGHDSGYISNPGTGKKDANSTDTTQARAALRWTPSGVLTVDASILYLASTTNGSHAIHAGLAPFNYTTLTPDRFDDDVKLFNLAGELDLGPVTIVSSTSYLDRKLIRESPIEFLIADFLHGMRRPHDNRVDQNVNDFTQEVRLISEPGRFRWTAGAFYQLQYRDYLQVLIEPGFDQLIGSLFGPPFVGSSTDLYFTPKPDTIYYAYIDTTDRQFAVFGEATYEILPRLNLTAGLRWFDHKNKASFYQTGILGALDVRKPFVEAGVGKSSGTNPRFLASYQVNENLLLFAEAARGFRFGGVNYPVPLAFCRRFLPPGETSFPLEFGPDNLWSYSIGEKATIGSIRANATAFLVKWNDVQTVRNLGCGYYYQLAEGKVESKGVEVELHARVTPQLDLGVSASYTDAAAASALPTVRAVAGDPVPLFPKWIVNLSGNYTAPIGRGDLLLSADYTYRGKSFTEFSPLVRQRQTIPTSHVVNASLSYAWDGWEAGIFGTNLTDDLRVSAVSAYGSPSRPGNVVTIGRPRRVGVRLKRSF